MRKPFDRMMKAGALLVGLTFAIASSGESREEQEHACRGDAFRFCAREIPSKEKIEACLKQHYDELSPPCKAMFDPPPTADPKS
ncbi:cysteine rich repeat-containing protein [Paraburkholderia heleia]